MGVAVLNRMLAAGRPNTSQPPHEQTETRVIPPFVC